jgi:hypothetical protein
MSLSDHGCDVSILIPGDASRDVDDLGGPWALRGEDSNQGSPLSLFESSVELLDLAVNASVRCSVLAHEVKTNESGCQKTWLVSPSAWMCTTLAR